MLLPQPNMPQTLAEFLALLERVPTALLYSKLEGLPSPEDIPTSHPYFAVFDTLAQRNAAPDPKPLWCLVRANGTVYQYDLDAGQDEAGGGWLISTLPGLTNSAGGGSGEVPFPSNQKYTILYYPNISTRNNHAVELNGQIYNFWAYVQTVPSRPNGQWYVYDAGADPDDPTSDVSFEEVGVPPFALQAADRTKINNLPTDTVEALAGKAPTAAGLTLQERAKLNSFNENPGQLLQQTYDNTIAVQNYLADDLNNEYTPRPEFNSFQSGVSGSIGTISSRLGTAEGTLLNKADKSVVDNLVDRVETIEESPASGGGNIIRLVHNGNANFPRGSEPGHREWFGWVQANQELDTDSSYIIPVARPDAVESTVVDDVQSITFAHMLGVDRVQTFRYTTSNDGTDLGEFTSDIAYSALTSVNGGARRGIGFIPYDPSRPFVRVRFVPAPIGRDTATDALRYVSDPSDEVEALVSVPEVPVATLGFFSVPTGVVADPVATQVFVIDVSGLGAFGSGASGSVLQAQWSFRQLIDGVWEPHTTGITYSLNNTRATVVTTFPDVETSGFRATFDTAGGGVDAIATRSVVVSAPSSAAPKGNFFWDFEEASGNWIDALSSLAIPRGATTRQSGPTGNHCLTTSAKVTVAQTLRTNHLEDPIYIAAFVFADQWGNFDEGDIGLGNFRISLGRDFARLHFVRDEVFEGSWSAGGLNSEPLRATAIGWYFIEGYYNPTTDLAGLAVNGSAFVTVPATSVARDGGAIQLNQSAARRLDKLFISNVIPSADERAWLYNGGAGRTAAEVAA